MATFGLSDLSIVVRRSAAITVAVLGVALLVISNTLNYNQQIALSAGFIGLLMITSGTTLELYRYLQDVRKRYPRSNVNSAIQSTAIRDIGRLSSKLVSAEAKLDLLQSRVESGDTTTYAGKEIPDHVTESLLKRVKEAATDKIVAEWSQKFGRTAILEAHVQQIRANIRDAVGSLEEEIDALRSRANLQMASGSVVSVFGFVVLGFFIYRAGDEIDVTHLDGKLFAYVALRVSLVIMIELFAYFFLRMYRYSIFEVKYFQNEISNIYMKGISVEIAFLGTEQKLRETIINELVRTERNVVLKKGDVTLAQLRDVAEREGDAVVLNFIKSIPDTFFGTANKLLAKEPRSHA